MVARGRVNHGETCTAELRRSQQRELILLSARLHEASFSCHFLHFSVVDRFIGRVGTSINSVGHKKKFGAMVDYHPISAKDQPRLNQFGAKVLPGVFLGHALYAGGIWKGDIMVADIEDLGDGRIRTPCPMAQCKGSVNPSKKWKLHIPSRRWNS